MSPFHNSRDLGVFWCDLMDHARVGGACTINPRPTSHCAAPSSLDSESHSTRDDVIVFRYPLPAIPADSITLFAPHRKKRERGYGYRLPHSKRVEKIKRRRKKNYRVLRK